MPYPPYTFIPFALNEKDCVKFFPQIMSKAAIYESKKKKPAQQDN